MPYCDSEYRRNYYLKNLEKARSQSRAWYAANREKVLGKLKQPDVRRKRRDLRYTREYGISLNELEKLAEKQRGLCAICNCSQTYINPRVRKHFYGLVVDHDHQTNVFRGLVCDRCNLVLGKVKDSTELLSKFVAYLGVKRG